MGSATRPKQQQVVAVGSRQDQQTEAHSWSATNCTKQSLPSIEFLSMGDNFLGPRVFIDKSLVNRCSRRTALPDTSHKRH